MPRREAVLDRHVTPVAGAIPTRRPQAPMLHQACAHPSFGVLLSDHPAIQAWALASAPLVDDSSVRGPSEFDRPGGNTFLGPRRQHERHPSGITKVVKRLWGRGILAPYHRADGRPRAPVCSVRDQNADCRGDTSVAETRHRRPEPSAPMGWVQMLNQVAGFGRMYHPQPTFRTAHAIFMNKMPRRSARAVVAGAGAGH